MNGIWYMIYTLMWEFNQVEVSLNLVHFSKIFLIADILLECHSQSQQLTVFENPKNDTVNSFLRELNFSVLYQIARVLNFKHQFLLQFI